jgi:photosystem II stability/assembly factor-like uncharacterized protein
MGDDFTVLVGTTGHGLFRSGDGGQSFDWINKGVSCNEVSVRGFTPDPAEPRHVLMATAIFDSGSPKLGTPYGLHESFDSGASWQPIEAFKGIECWRVTYDLKNPGRYYVGTRPAAIYRTDDGVNFEKLNTNFPATCRGIGLPRVTSINVHPVDPDFLFVSLEIGGFFRSLDGGKTWEQVLQHVDIPPPNGAVFGEGGREDGHYSVISRGSPELVIASTPDGPYRSADRGATWELQPIKQVFAAQYHHDLAIRPDNPDALYYGVGDDTVGSHGALLYTRDRGATWAAAQFPQACNSPIWSIAQHTANPDRIVTCTHYGMVFRSDDAGDTWTKLSKEFTETRAVCWLPN